MKRTEAPLRVECLVEAYFGLDGGAMFGIVPRPLWERSNPADPRNRIDLACRCLLVTYPDRRVLVDVGIGSLWTEKERDIYKIEGQDSALSRGLEDCGCTAGDIDEVVLTHLHFDHAGGLTRPGPDGGRVPAFPKARHWVQRRNWSWANGPSPRDAGSYRVDDFRWLECDGAPDLVLVDGPSEILPGIEVIPCDGHTFGMQVVKVTTDEATYVFVADLIPTSSHLRDAYVMGYDLQPLVTVKEKRMILHEALRHDWILIYEHDPLVAMSRVERRSGKLVAAPV
jgi:glyoxylase-like metal-dependent hydrolase (beta-lactamase superfamily II)